MRLQIQNRFMNDDTVGSVKIPIRGIVPQIVRIKPINDPFRVRHSRIREAFHRKKGMIGPVADDCGIHDFRAGQFSEFFRIRSVTIHAECIGVAREDYFYGTARLVTAIAQRIRAVCL